MTQISFAGVTSFEPLEPGDYSARFVEFKVVESSKSSGHPYVALTFNITEEGLENRKQWRNYSLQPQALWALKQALDLMGATYDAEEDFAVEDILRECIGAEVVLEVGTTTYQGKVRNEVKALKESRLF